MRTHWSDFFMDGRKIFISLISTIILLLLYFVYKIEIVPYDMFIVLFSKYFEELPPLWFLIFYYFIVTYVFSSIIVIIYDIIKILTKKRRKNG